MDGGGGITFEPAWGRPVGELPKPDDALAIDGGGGITLALREVPCPPFGDVRELPAEELAETLGGGGTTSWVPKSFPMIVLTNEPLAACVGGGGMTRGAEDGTPPLSSLRISRSVEADGGGATTEGDGKFSFAVRVLSRSGAETGGGTTATLFICTREGETSWVTSEGAGAITRPLSDGAERAWSRETRVDAGAITFALREGALRLLLLETLGAGAMMEESRRGAKRV
jgi:hypothetical protein